jgi:hypothetical protein
MTVLRRHPVVVSVALIVGFLAFRAVLFAVTTAGEYRLYRDYGETARQTSLAELYRTRDIEYPHLSVGWGALIGVIADALPDPAVLLVRWRPNKWEEQYLSETPEVQEAGDRYEVALGLVLFAVDVGCLVLVWLIARRTYPTESTLARTARLIAYTIGTGAIGLILYDRQDLIVGAAALLAVLALATGRPAVGYAILTLGTGYKLVPALLLPVWVLAAATVRATSVATPRRFLCCVVWEATVAAVFLSAWPILTYTYGGGERGFLFLTFHSARGLQLEAPIAWPVLLLDPSTQVGHGYGSFNLRGDLADRVARPTRVLMPLSVLLAVAISVPGFWRAATRGARNPDAVPIDHAAIVPHVVATSILVWLGFILTNKVGSPQYLLWVAPLVPLLPLRSWWEWGWAGAFLLVAILTTAIFPCAYPDVLGRIVKNDPLTWAGPTPVCLFLLAAKSVTLTIVVGWLAVYVWRTRSV